MARKVKNWIDGFMYYTKESESPDNYLKWTAIFTIAAATQRRVHTHWVYWTFYPNVYVMLVGPAGKVHKSSSLRFARKMLVELGVPCASEAISKEALILQMKSRGIDNQALAIVASEFATFIRTSGPPMVEFLTDIYDCEDNWEYTTKSGGTATIERPFMTMLAGVVPDWIAAEFDATFVQGGFASRTLFVVAHEPRFRKAFAQITPDMDLMRTQLVEDLMEISTLQGEFHWTPAAEAWFEHWYEKELPKERLDYRLEGYLSRKPTHAIRLAMILSLAESNDLVIEERHFKQAEKYLDELEPKMVQAFAAVGRNPYANDHERIAAEIIEAGGMTRGQLVDRNIHAMDRKVLDELLENLELMGKIVKHYTPGKDIRYEPA